MKPILEIQNISKKFRINHEQQAYLSLRDSLTSIFKHKASSTEDFWALKDVSFDVMPGDTLGIVGKNGAGKSTLLKILSKITPPTSGRILSRGRIASLLEVGTGFHPELSGRENIFLNGSILGMKRKEIASSYDAIVDFAGVEKFIDTPVKHYSSGMYVRLAFAVAAHLNPEILIIDEVLAVGDTEFQKKCIGKMGEVAKSGRTVLFVSHNMQAVNTLCNKAILLENGKVKHVSNAADIIRLYNNVQGNNVTFWEGNEGDDNVRLLETKIISTGFYTDEMIEVQIKYSVINPVLNLVVGFHLKSEFDYELAYSIKGDYGRDIKPITEKGTYTEVFKIPPHTLSKGNFFVRIDLGIHDVKFICQGKGDLNFFVMNRNQIGCRFPVVDVKGYCSLFRPHWHAETLV